MVRTDPGTLSENHCRMDRQDRQSAPGSLAMASLTVQTPITAPRGPIMMPNELW